MYALTFLERVIKKRCVKVAAKAIVIICIVVMLMLTQSNYPQFQQADSSTISILLWNPIFGQDKIPSLATECAELTCFLTLDRSFYETSAAVVFHMPDLNNYTQERLPNQHFVFFSLESPINTKLPNMEVSPFTLTVTYQPDSDIAVPYAEMLPRQEPMSSHEYEATLHSLRSAFKEKRFKVAWFASSCNPESRRGDYIQELTKHIDVHIYGRCGRRNCSRRNGNVCDQLIRRDYKFTLAFENSVCNYYTTEKPYTALQNLVIPVVLNRKIAESTLPSGSFIAADDFKSPRQLANYLTHLSENVDDYLKYFKWLKLFHKPRMTSMATAFCKLCAFLEAQSPSSKVTPSETARNALQWYTEERQCYPRYAYHLLRMDRRFYLKMNDFIRAFWNFIS
ncbi:hypothetical protein M514_03453 [Trichuris suis]|uniref:Fucosyltransferase n=1 Tax=Trichuris suis TaxID=68888 RepID=A0A085NDR2_9BILA|nr:hypothetical protein M514_03453 [Trichuris suis]